MSEEERPRASQGYPRRGFPKVFFRPKPVQVGQELEVTITEVGRRGEGLARVQGYVIFVPNTQKGDTVKIKITQIRPNYALGQVV